MYCMFTPCVFPARWVTSRAQLWSWVLRTPWYVQMTPQSSAVYRPNGLTLSSCGPQKGHHPSINLGLSHLSPIPTSGCTARRLQERSEDSSLSLHYILGGQNRPDVQPMDDALRLALTQSLLFAYFLLDYWANSVFKALGLNKHTLLLFGNYVFSFAICCVYQMYLLLQVFILFLLTFYINLFTGLKWKIFKLAHRLWWSYE